MLRLAANLSTLFTELPLLERPAAAAQAGFDAVELQFPYEVTAPALASACRAAGVRVVLINVPAGERTAGELGLAAVPGREVQFLAAVDQAAAYARALGCPQVNSLAGRVAETDRDGCWQTLVANTREAARRLAAQGVVLLCEVLNPVDVPDFVLTRSADGERLLNAVGHPNLRLQFDIYHRVSAGEDWARELRRQLAHVGHIQFSDHPGRHQPGTGGLDWARVFGTLESLDFPGHVGCEYFPLGHTRDSFGWRGLLMADGE